MSLLKNASICMCALTQMAFAITPEEEGKKEGFQWKSFNFQQKQENTTEIKLSTAQRAFPLELRRLFEEECAAAAIVPETFDPKQVMDSLMEMLRIAQGDSFLNLELPQHRTFDPFLPAYCS
jgi:hypothetical protein